MKDIEKIKSEDLAAQVQDANPANFAIEQEVAQLVGATVPHPTEPSADDARELGAQLLVFLRRALLPIRSALRTAVAAIYAYLDSRCTDYTPAAYDPFRLPAGPYDPMRPFAPRTLPNLLTALTAFSARKISNGSAPSDGIPDGTSLAHLLCGDNTATYLCDDNTGWTMTRNIPFEKFPNLTRISLWCKEIPFGTFVGTNGTMISGKTLDELDLRYTEKITSGWHQEFIGSCVISSYRFDSLKEIGVKGFLRGCTGCDKIVFPVLEKFKSQTYTNPSNESPFIVNCGFKEVEATKLSSITVAGQYAFKDNADLHTLKLGNIIEAGGMISNCPSLIYLQFEGVQVSLNLSGWNPTDKGTTFLQNFREHIALRLTANGTGLTLTLSQAVRNAIHAAESTYGIENIITQKGWTISPAPN